MRKCPKHGCKMHCTELGWYCSKCALDEIWNVELDDK